MHGGEVGEHAAQPALVHVRHADAGGLVGDRFLRLLLGADEHDAAAVGDGLLDELVRLVDVGQRLLQVDDVDAVAVGEDEPLHLGIPATGLMPEVGAAVKQLLHGYNSHECALFTLSVVVRRRVKPDPGACCVTGPVPEFRAGTDRHTVTNSGSCRRRAKSARASELRVAVYTVETGALSTLTASSTAVRADGWRFRPQAAELGGCAGWRWSCVLLVTAAPARADDVRLSWPLRPRPAVMRGLRRAVARLEPWPPRCRPGRRRRSAGVRRGAGDGGVRGSAGRPPGRVTGACGRAAHQLRAGAGGGTGGTARGRVHRDRHAWCPVTPAARPACLHWGAMWGPAARADYVDPLGLLASTRIRLKPLHPVVRASAASPFSATVRVGPRHAADIRTSVHTRAERRPGYLRPAGAPGRARRAAGRR